MNHKGHEVSRRSQPQAFPANNRTLAHLPNRMTRAYVARPEAAIAAFFPAHDRQPLYNCASPRGARHKRYALLRKSCMVHIEKIGPWFGPDRALLLDPAGHRSG